MVVNKQFETEWILEFDEKTRSITIAIVVSGETVPQGRFIVQIQTTLFEIKELKAKFRLDDIPDILMYKLIDRLDEELDIDFLGYVNSYTDEREKMLNFLDKFKKLLQ